MIFGWEMEAGRWEMGDGRWKMEAGIPKPREKDGSLMRLIDYWILVQFISKICVPSKNINP